MPWFHRWRIATIVALYAVLAGLWILLSDRAAALVTGDPANLTRFQTAKEWVFVAATAALLALILRYEARSRDAREQALRDSEETYRTLIEVESDAVVLIENATGRLLAANPAAAALYGYTHAELLALRNTDLSADPAETARVTTQTPLAPEAVIRIPLRYHKKRDGTVFPVEITGRYFAWRGRPVHLAAIRDIAAREQAEATMARHRLLAEQARDIVLFVRRDGWLLEANQAAVQTYGYTPEEFGALHIQDLRAPDTHALTAAQLAQADAQGLLFETIHRRKDGTTFPVEVSSRGADLGGERVLFSIIRDITERKRAEDALATRTRQLEAVRAVSEDIIRELDLARLLHLLISRAAELVGATTGTVYLWDSTVQILLPGAWHGLGDWQGTIRLRLGEAVAGAAAQTRQTFVVNDYRTSPYAHPLTLEYTGLSASLGEPLLYRDELIGAITIGHEGGRTFTEHDMETLRLFAAQAAIAIQNARLYDSAQQALTDLRQAQEELIRSEKLRGLGQMAAGIAHDLNNTLATVLGQTELLRLRTRSPEIREGLEILQTAAADGAQVVRRLQDFARQRSGGALGPCDLAKLVRETLEITRPRWQHEPCRKGIVIETTVELNEIPPIQGNPAEIREALTNLIFNAVDAMPHGGYLHFTGRVVENAAGAPANTPGTGRVELAVADTGIGMTEAVRQRIFDPFFTTKGLHGTGLGLSVVYGIMERHDGQIDVSSTPGHGVTFRLRFRSAAVADQGPSPPTPPSVPTRRILLVDDDAGVRKTLASLLRASGQDVLEAGSGTEALDWLQTTAVDLVLTDLGMPDITGWDVARAAKARRPDLPVVLLTGWGDQAGTEIPSDAGVDRILAKPVPRGALLTVIAELVEPPDGKSTKGDLHADASDARPARRATIHGLADGGQRHRDVQGARRYAGVPGDGRPLPHAGIRGHAGLRRHRDGQQHGARASARPPRAHEAV